MRELARGGQARVIGVSRRSQTNKECVTLSSAFSRAKWLREAKPSQSGREGSGHALVRTARRHRRARRQPATRVGLPIRTARLARLPVVGGYAGAPRRPGGATSARGAASRADGRRRRHRQHRPRRRAPRRRRHGARLRIHHRHRQGLPASSRRSASRKGRRSRPATCCCGSMPTSAAPTSSRPRPRPAARPRCATKSRSGSTAPMALSRTGAGTGAQVEDLTAQVKSLESAIASADARRKAAEARLEDLIVRAPFAAALGTRSVSLGAYVSPGTRITTLDDLSAGPARFRRPGEPPRRAQDRPDGPRDVGCLSASASSRAGCRSSTRASIRSPERPPDRRVPEPRRGAQARHVPVRRARGDDQERRRGGSRGGDRRRRPSPPRLSVVKDNMVERRVVRIGQRQEGQVEVVDGLKPGEIDHRARRAARARPAPEVDRDGRSVRPPARRPPGSARRPCRSATSSHRRSPQARSRGSSAIAAVAPNRFVGLITSRIAVIWIEQRHAGFRPLHPPAGLRRRRQPAAHGRRACGAACSLPVREYPQVDRPVVSVTTIYQGRLERGHREPGHRAHRRRRSRASRASARSPRRARTSAPRCRSSSRSGAIPTPPPPTCATRLAHHRPACPTAPTRRSSARSTRTPPAIMWVGVTSTTLDALELTDFLKRVYVDRLSTVPGVANVYLGGERRYAMRIWIDRAGARGARPDGAGRRDRDQAAERRAARRAHRLVEARAHRQDGFPPRHARRNSSRSSSPTRTATSSASARSPRSRSAPRTTASSSTRTATTAIGLGIVRQSTANTLSVADGVRSRARAAQARRCRPAPRRGHRTTRASSSAPRSTACCSTLVEGVGLVILVILVFLRDWRSTIVAMVAIPVSVIAAFMVMAFFGASINVLTLLAIVLAIGIVVDDAIVEIENVHRRIERRRAAAARLLRRRARDRLRGHRHDRDADGGVRPARLHDRQYRQAVPRIRDHARRRDLLLRRRRAHAHADDVLEADGAGARPHPAHDRAGLRGHEQRLSLAALASAASIPLVILAIGGARLACRPTACSRPSRRSSRRPRTAAPSSIRDPGARRASSLDYTRERVKEVEQRAPAAAGAGHRLVHAEPGGAGLHARPSPVNDGLVIVRLVPWDQRTVKQQDIVQQLTARSRTSPARAPSRSTRGSLGQRGLQQPIQFVLGGPDYETLRGWRDIVMQKAQETGLFVNLDSELQGDRSPTSASRSTAQRAADLGVSIEDIGRTLELMFGETRGLDLRQPRRGISTSSCAPAPQDRATPNDLTNMFVRADERRSRSALVLRHADGIGRAADAQPLRPAALDHDPVGSLTPGVSIGEGLETLEQIVQDEPAGRGAHRLHRASRRISSDASSAIYVTFGMALLVVFLVLAGAVRELDQSVHHHADGAARRHRRPAGAVRSPGNRSTSTARSA